MRRPIHTWKNTLDQLGLVLKRFVNPKSKPRKAPTFRLATEALERRDMFTVTISNFHLVSDTGASSTDLVTSDPRVGGTSGGTFSGSAGVQFDHNNDGASDGSVSIMMSGNTFTYDPRTMDFNFPTSGSVPFRYRTTEYNPMTMSTTYGSWQNFTFTMQPPPAPEIDVADSSNANIADDTGSYSFGSTPVGTAVSRTFTIHNTGTDTLTLSTASLSLPSGFTLVTPFASSVAAAGQTSFTVQLNATTGGSFSGQLSFTNNDSNESPYNFTISGTAVQVPTVSSIHLVSDTGTSSTDLVTSDPRVGATVSGSFTGNLQIQFDHNGDGTSDGNVPITMQGQSFTYDPRMSDANFPTTGAIALKYRAAVQDVMTSAWAYGAWSTFNYTMEVPANPEIDVTDEWFANVPDNLGSVSLGSTQLGTPVSRVFTIHNLGTTNLLLDQNSFTLPTGFSLVSGYAASVAPNGQTSFTIRLDATTQGNYSGGLSFTTNDADENPFNFTISGTVLNDQPEIEVRQSATNIPDNSGSFDFGSTVEGTAVSKTFTINNTGTGTLNLSTGSFTLPSGFTLVTPFSSTVNPQGGQTTFVVRLDATTAGSYSGQLSFTSNDSDESPYNFTISGTVNSNTPEIVVHRASGDDVADGSGSVDFGSTSVNGAASQTFFISNTGYGTLTLDPNSISLPTGYSVVSPFTSTVAAQGQTSFIVQLSSATAGTYSGTLSFATNDADENPFNFAVTGTVSSSGGGGGGGGGGGSNASLSVDMLHLTNDTGTWATDRLTYDPTVTALVNWNVQGGTATIEFDHDGDGMPDGSVNVAHMLDSFTYDPRAADSALANFNGTLPLAYRGILHSSTGETLLTTDWTPFTIDLMVDPAVAGLGIDYFGLEKDTGSSNSDRITVLPSLVGVVTGDFGTGSARVEFDQTGDGTPDGSVDVAESDDSFLYDPRSVDPSLFGYVGALTIGHRLVKLDADGEVTDTGPWSQYHLTLAAPAGTGRTISGIALVNDTGSSNSDKVTFDPTITGTVSAGGGTSSLYASGAQVEFDLDGNGTVDAHAGIGGDGKFQFQPAGLSYAEHTLHLRVREWNDDYQGFVTGAWQSFTFTLVPEPAVAVDSIALKTDDGTSTTDKITSDPTLAGKLVGAATDLTPAADNVNHVKIELDLDGNGTSDAAVYTDSSGQFTYRPTGLAAGQITVNARASRVDSSSGEEVVGVWLAFTFTYAPAVPATIAELKLVNDNGTSTTDNITDDPTLSGKLTGANVANVYVEFDHNGDGQIDGTATSDSLGNFGYVPYGISPGEATIRARACLWDADFASYVHGGWTSFTFTLTAAAQAPVMVGGFGLAVDDGPNTADHVSTQATLSGTVSGGHSVAFVTMQFDLDANGTVDDTVQTDDAGQFTFVPIGLALGEHTVMVRAKEWDYAQGHGVYGDWTSFTFTLAAPVNTPPVVTEFHLQADTGSLGTDGVTANPTVAGTITNDGTPARLTVEFDHDGDGVVDGTTATESDGTFLYEPTPLSFGPVTIAARGVEWDEAAGVYQRGPWVSLSFTYQDQPNAAPALVELAVAPPGPLDYQPRAVGLAGRIVNEGNLAGQTVEFDYDGDGLFDGTAQTDKYGKFSFTPADLAYGASEIHVRTRELDDITRQFLYGPWTAFSFDNVEPVNQAAMITTLALANDTGTDGDGTSTDDTLTGQITNDGLLDGVTIQFDLDNDDASDGEATTDEAGLFTFQPADLAAGQHTVRARSLEYSGAGVAIEGAWHSVTFTLVAAADPTLRVDTLSLSHDTGDSDSDGATDNPAIEGTVVGSSVSGVSVQIDIDGDGQTDVTTTTDSSGHFSVTPQNLVEGRITAQARVAPPDGDTGDSATLGGGSLVGTSGGWKSLSFIYSSDPDGATAQLLVTSFHNFDQDWQAAQNTYDGTLATANSTYRGAYAAAVGAYNATLSAAGAARATVVTAATATYSAAKNLAERAYVAAVTADGTTFTANLANFTGDTSSFTLPDFQWPDAPVDNSLIIPDDSSQATPPGTSPNYDFTPFDWNAEKAYLSAVQGKAKLRDDLMLAANATFAAAQKDANDAYNLAKGIIETAYENNIAGAETAYKNALVAGTNPVDMVAERAAYNAKVQQARDTYHLDLRNSADKFGKESAALLPAYMLDMVAINASYLAAMIAAGPHSVDPGELHDSLLRMANVNIDWTAAVEAREVQYTSDQAGYAQDRAGRDAKALYKRDKALADLQDALDLSQAAYDYWNNQRTINAQKARTDALANFVLTREQALSEKARLRDNDIATARQVQSMSVATATFDYTKGVAELRQVELHSYVDFQQTSAATYEMEVADHQVTYLTSLRPEYLLHEEALSGATKTEEFAQSQAKKTQADSIATAERDRAVDGSLALKKLQDVSNLADMTRAGSNAYIWRTQDLARASAEKQNSLDLAAAQRNLSVDNAEASAAYEVAKKVVDRDYVYDTDQAGQAAKAAALVVQQKVYSDAQADATYTYAYASIAADERRALARSLATKNYEDDYYTAEQTELLAVNAAYNTRDDDLAQAEYDYSIHSADALVANDGQVAQAELVWWQTTAPADETYADFDAGFQETETDADEVSWQGFEVDVATAFSTKLGLWSTFVNTPWAAFEYKLAQDELTRVTTQSLADVVYASEEAASETEREVADDAIEENYELGVAQSYDTRSAAMSAAFYQFVSGTAGAREAQAVLVAGDTGDHDQAVVAQDLAYQDLLADEQEVLQDGIDAALWKYRRAAADAEHDLAKQLISTGQFNQRLTDASQTELEEESVAEIAHANHLATARQAWVSSVGALNVALADQQAQAAGSLANSIDSATVALANGRDDAVRGLTTALALGLEGRTDDDALADAQYAVETTAEDAVYALAADQTDSTIRTSNALDRADYEIALFTKHATALAAAAQADPSALVAYQSSYAQYDLERVVAARAALVDYENVLAADSATLTTELNARDYAGMFATAASQGSDTQHTIDEAAAERARTVAYSNALADEVRDQRASAAHETKAEVQTEWAYQALLAADKAIADNQAAAADVTWVAAMASARGALHNSLGSSGAQATFDAAQLVADTARQSSLGSAGINYASLVGDARIARAGSLGDALIVQANALGQAELDYTQALNVADDVYEPTVDTIDVAQETLDDAAWEADDLGVAQDEAGSSHAQDVANAAYVAALDAADVAHATHIATVDGIYEFAVASALSTRTASWATLEGTTAASVKAATASAMAGWISATAPAIVTSRTQGAQADAAHDAALMAQALALDSQNLADEMAHNSAIEAARDAQSIAALVRQGQFEQAQAGLEDAFSLSVSSDDKTFGIAEATDVRLYGLDLALAEKAYQVGLASGTSGTVLLKARSDALADAQLAREIRQADADLAFIDFKAQADDTLATGEDLAVEDLDFDIDDLNEAFMLLAAAQDAGLAHAHAVAENSTLSLEQLAENSWEASRSQFKNAFQVSADSGYATVTSAFSSTVGSPWAQYQSSLSAAEATWRAGTSQINADWNSGSATIWNAYETSLNPARVSMRAAIDAAELTRLNVESNAEDALGVANVTARTNYLLAQSGTTDIYAQASALAARNQRVALATAARNLAVGTDANGNTFDQAAYDQAVVTANSQQALALKNSAQAYAVAESVARGAEMVAESSANFDYAGIVSAAETADEAAIQTAEHALSLIQSHSSTVLVTGLATLDAAHTAQLSDSFSAALAAFAAGSGSPWALFDAQKVAAETAQVEALSQEDVILTAALQAADEAVTNAVELAVETLVNSMATASGSWSQSAANAYKALNTGESGAIVALGAAGGYKPALPTVPLVTAPKDWSDLDPASVADFFRAGLNSAGANGLDTFDAFSGDMFRAAVDTAASPAGMTPRLLLDPLRESLKRPAVVMPVADYSRTAAPTPPSPALAAPAPTAAAATGVIIVSPTTVGNPLASGAWGVLSKTIQRISGGTTTLPGAPIIPRDIASQMQGAAKVLKTVPIVGQTLGGAAQTAADLAERVVTKAEDDGTNVVASSLKLMAEKGKAEIKAAQEWKPPEWLKRINRGVTIYTGTMMDPLAGPFIAPFVTAGAAPLIANGIRDQLPIDDKRKDKDIRRAEIGERGLRALSNAFDTGIFDLNRSVWLGAFACVVERVDELSSLAAGNPEEANEKRGTFTVGVFRDIIVSPLESLEKLRFDLSGAMTEAITGNEVSDEMLEQLEMLTPMGSEAIRLGKWLDSIFDTSDYPSNYELGRAAAPFIGVAIDVATFFIQPEVVLGKVLDRIAEFSRHMRKMTTFDGPLGRPRIPGPHAPNVPNVPDVPNIPDAPHVHGVPDGPNNVVPDAGPTTSRKGAALDDLPNPAEGPTVTQTNLDELADAKRKARTKSEIPDEPSLDSEPVTPNRPVDEVPPLTHNPDPGTLRWPNGIPKEDGLPLVDSVRRSLHVKVTQNIGLAEAVIEGRPRELMVGVSGQASPPGTVPSPTKRLFETHKTRGAIPTNVDSEVKILEHIAKDLPRDAKGTVNLFTERPPCPSCRRVIKDFEKMFPDVKVIVTDGGR